MSNGSPSDHDVAVAVQLHAAGRLPEAEQAYRRLIAQGCGDPAIYNNLAALCIGSGRLDDAVAAFRHVATVTPDVADAHYHLGLSLALKGSSEEAITAFRRAIVLAPQHYLAHHNLGVALRHQQKIEDAIASFRQATLLKPDYFPAHIALATLAADANQPEVAVAAYRRAAELKPGEVEILLALSRLLRSQGRLAESAVATTQALAIAPNNAEARFLHALTLHNENNFAEAIAELNEALRVDPNHAFAHAALGVTYADQGRIAEAMSSFDRALALQPDNDQNRSNAIYFASTTQFRTPEEILEFSRAFDRTPDLTDPHKVAASGKIRVGFISAEIGNHAVSYFLETYLRHYDRNRIEVTLFPTIARSEARSAMLLSLADNVVNLRNLSDDDGRAAIGGRNIDILIDTTSHMAGSRLRMLSRRCAPIQCHWIGFNGSTGVAAIDFFIGDDEVTPPEFASHYIEELIRLPGLWMAYTPPAELPAPETLSPPDQVTFGCFNNLTKVREETLDHWAAALRAVPEARLLLKDRMCADAFTRTRITETLNRAGVAPQRLEFIARVPSWTEHMHLYNRVDIALDTLPLNSGTTGFDALIMATPLVALRGGWMGARMSSSMLKALGKPEWIASSPTEFAAVVAGLAADRPQLKGYKKTLRADVLASPLCDGKTLATDVEAAFARMIAAHNAKVS